MIPSIFQHVIQNPAVIAALGSSPTKFYGFGDAPQGVTGTYAVWQVVSGSPENYLDCPPNYDNTTIQIDVYGDLPGPVATAATALRDAIQSRAYITRWGGQQRERDTKLYRISFDVSWFESR